MTATFLSIFFTNTYNIKEFIEFLTLFLLFIIINSKHFFLTTWKGKPFFQKPPICCFLSMLWPQYKHVINITKPNSWFELTYFQGSIFLYIFAIMEDKMDNP